MAKVEKASETQPIVFALILITLLVFYLLVQEVDSAWRILQKLTDGRSLSISQRGSPFLSPIILISTGLYLSVSIYQFGNESQRTVMMLLTLLLLIAGFYVFVFLVMPPIKIEGIDL